MKDKIKKFLPWILLVCWCILIFAFSARTAVDSTKDSDKIVRSLLKRTDPDLYKKVTIIVRKSAHFFLYFVLGIFSLPVFFSVKQMKRTRLFSISFCVLYAISDELHQFFVPGRSCEVADVLLDSMAAFLSILLFYHIIRRCQNCKQK